MGSRVTAKTKAPLDALVASQKAAWQRWNSTRAGWETKVQQLCHTNFVFQVVWEPRCRELWGQQRAELIDATLLAKRAWEVWQLTLVPEPGKAANRFSLPSESATTTSYHWRTLLQETQPVWHDVLTELKRAIPDDQLFLPADVRRLMTDLHQACQQIIQSTEQSMLTWDSWVAQQQGALGQSAAQSPKPHARGTSRTRNQAQTASLTIQG
ncbi:MAG: hypothetical protein U0350_23685 [Caldilineaceae bacterium]